MKLESPVTQIARVLVLRSGMFFRARRLWALIRGVYTPHACSSHAACAMQ